MGCVVESPVQGYGFGGPVEGPRVAKQIIYLWQQKSARERVG